MNLNITAGFLESMVPLNLQESTAEKLVAVQDIAMPGEGIIGQQERSRKDNFVITKNNSSFSGICANSGVC